MSFRNAVILSLCLAAGMGTLSGCAYTDKYVEIVLVDPGGQPERLTSHSKSNMPADTVNPANSVCAQDNGAYDGTVDDGTVKEEKKPEEPKKTPKPSATPEATQTHAYRRVDASAHKHAAAHGGCSGGAVRRGDKNGK